MNNAVLSVIEEALKAAAYTDDFATDYAHANAPAVLSRVLAALGGEPPVAWMYLENRPDGSCGRSLTSMRWTGYEQKVQYAKEIPLYAAPPFDIAAVRAVAEELNTARSTNERFNETVGVGLRRLAYRLLRAIGDGK